MKDRIYAGISVGFFISIPWLILTYLGYKITQLPIIPFKLFEALVFISPGEIITPMLELMIEVIHKLQIGPTSSIGKSVEMGIAFLLGFIILILLGILYAITLDRLHLSWGIKGLINSLVLTMLLLPLVNPFELFLFSDYSKVIWILSINFIWGLSLAWGGGKVVATIEQDENASRNRILAQIGIGTLSVGVLALGLDRLFLNPNANKPTEIASENSSVINQPSSPPQENGFSPVHGTREEITPMEEFYRVDINLLPPGQEDYARNADDFTRRLLAQGGDTDLPADSYILIVEGLVENPLVLDLNAIKLFPKVEQYATLSCISNPISGDLIGTTYFQGARLNDIMARAIIKPEAVDLKFTCIDGYSESLSIEKANDDSIILCYSMGNQPLSKNHGAPLRVYSPGRYGMKSPKWIIKIEAINDDYLGYWQQQGWSEPAWVQTTAVIDTIKSNDRGLAVVGGIAYAGDRGIRSVEVKSDNGTWIPAELNRPLSPLTWVLWRAELELPPGESMLTVRTTDGDRNPQIEEKANTHPNGATGYHSMTIDINS